MKIDQRSGHLRKRGHATTPPRTGDRRNRGNTTVAAVFDNYAAMKAFLEEVKTAGKENRRTPAEVARYTARSYLRRDQRFPGGAPDKTGLLSRRAK